MDPTSKYQCYQCPDEFQERLTEIGGFNIYDEPNFIIRWSQGDEDECFYRAGGIWTPPGLPSYKGYRWLLKGGGTPSWALMQWHSAEEYGTPEMYYIQNRDEATGLQILGEYPYSGRYEVLYNLRWLHREGNRLVCESMPLNDYILDTLVPIIMMAKDISWEKTKAVMKDIKEREDAAQISEIEDAMRSAALPFKGNPVSYTKQGCRTALVDKKIETMQRMWNVIQRNAQNLAGKDYAGRGLMQRAM